MLDRCGRCASDFGPAVGDIDIHGLRVARRVVDRTCARRRCPAPRTPSGSPCVRSPPPVRCACHPGLTDSRCRYPRPSVPRRTDRPCSRARRGSASRPMPLWSGRQRSATLPCGTSGSDGSARDRLAAEAAIQAEERRRQICSDDIPCGSRSGCCETAGERSRTSSTRAGTAIVAARLEHPGKGRATHSATSRCRIGNDGGERVAGLCAKRNSSSPSSKPSRMCPISCQTHRTSAAIPSGSAATALYPVQASAVKNEKSCNAKYIVIHSRSRVRDGEERSSDTRD